MTKAALFGFQKKFEEIVSGTDHVWAFIVVSVNSRFQQLFIPT